MQNAPPGGERMLRVPYGHEELEFMVQPWFDVDIVESAPATPVGDLAEAARASLRSPLGTKRLRELAADAVRSAGTRRPRAVIAVTDLTRACPDEVLVPPRRGAGSAAHPSRALSAAANAAATSSGPDAWNEPTRSSVFAGLMFWKVR